MADSYKVNPITGKLDIVGSAGAGSSEYAGDVAATPTGQSNGYMAVIDGKIYFFTDGNRYVVAATLVKTGSPVGLLLTLTHS